MNKKSNNVLAIVSVLIATIVNINAISSEKIEEKIKQAQRTSIPWYIGFNSKRPAEEQSNKLRNQWGLNTKIGLKTQENYPDLWQVLVEPIQDDEGTGMLILRKGFTSEADAISYSDDLKRSLALSNEIIKRSDGTYWAVWKDQMVWQEKTPVTNETISKITTTNETISKTTATYAVSVGSFSKRSDAEKHVIDMERRYGQTCEIKETVLDNGRRTTYRVAAYFTNNENDAKQYAIFWRRQINRRDDDRNAAFAFDWKTDKIL